MMGRDYITVPEATRLQSAAREVRFVSVNLAEPLQKVLDEAARILELAVGDPELNPPGMDNEARKVMGAKRAAKAEKERRRDAKKAAEDKRAAAEKERLKAEERERNRPRPAEEKETPTLVTGLAPESVRDGTKAPE